MKILVFGNLLVEKDNLTLKILPELKQQFPQIQFKEIDPTENLESEIENKKLFILDVARGIKKSTRIKDLNKLQTNKIFSLHDFDLAHNLKLLKKIGKLDKVEIIAIPRDISEKEALFQTQLIFKKCVAQDMHGS